jgi:RNA polymerase sigma-70 factor (ECF subfamily)
MARAEERPPEEGLGTDRLARRARGGDADGYAELYGRVAPAVYAWASLHIRPALRARLDPEDVLQEVACRAWSSFASWDERQGPFRAWLFGIARNVLREGLRRLAAEPAARGDALLTTRRLAALPDTATAVTTAVARDEGLRLFLGRVDALPDEERRLVMFRGLEGLSHGEVASLLSITPGAVAKRWQRLCERLRGEPRWAEIIAA